MVASTTVCLEALWRGPFNVFYANCCITIKDLENMEVIVFNCGRIFEPMTR